VHQVVHMNLRLLAYKVQLSQALEPNEKPKWREFAVNMLERISENEAVLRRACFSDEATNNARLVEKNWQPLFALEQT